MSAFDAEEQFTLASLEDPVLTAEMLEQLDTTLLSEIAMQACLIVAEEQIASLHSPTARLIPLPVQVAPVDERARRQKRAALMPLVLLAVLLVFGGIFFANILTPSAGVQNIDTSNGTMFSSRPIVHTGYTVTTGNELTAKQVDQLFAESGSPAAGDGQIVVDLGNKYGIDNLYFPAWYLKETSMGKTGVASVNNPTGMGCSDLCPRCSGPDSRGRNWCEFDTIPQGIEAWFRQTRERYVSGLIDQVCSYRGGRRVCHPGAPLITIYLMACGPDGQGMYDDGAVCSEYAQNIETIVDGWRARFGS